MYLYIVFSLNIRTLAYFPVSILYRSIAGRYRPVRVANGPITARFRFIKNASWVVFFLLRIMFVNGKNIMEDTEEMPNYETQPS